MSRVTKRFCDLLVALFALILLTPVLAVVAVAIRLTMGAPVLFRQPRPGYRGCIFTVLKFRTMREATGPEGKPLSDGERLTRVGGLLRKTSLDEIPQLWNVLTGQMSLVGPRPLLVRYTPFFTERERLRFTVPPGITGWAQIHGRNEASWDERLANDVWYVEHWNLWLDFQILCVTFLKVFRAKGVVVDANAIMQDLDQERLLRQPTDSGEDAAHG